MQKKSFLIFAVVFAAEIFSSLTAESSKTITVWCSDPYFSGYAMKQAAAVYNRAHPGTTIAIVDIPDNMEGRIETGLQIGGVGLPDIVLLQDYMIERFIEDNPNAFVDLKAAGVDYSKFAQYKVGPMTFGDKIYGIPFDTGSTGFWLRSDYIRAAGLNPDDYQKKLTWSDVINLGIAIKAKTNKPLIAYDISNLDFIRIMVHSSGTQFFTADGSLNLRTPAIERSIAVLKELNDKGLLYLADGWPNWVYALNDGITAGFMNAVWMIGTVKSKPENAGKWMVIPTPLLEGVSGAQNASNNGGSSWYIIDSSPNKAVAIDFLKSTWASSDPAALEFYNTILKGAGAMGTYLPSRQGSNYNSKDGFFYNDQAVYRDFSSWMVNVPVIMYTSNYPIMIESLKSTLFLLLQNKINSVDEAIANAEAGYKNMLLAHYSAIRK